VCLQPPAPAAKERSRVRSNAWGGAASLKEASVGSDNSASSIDNPAVAAAAAAAAAELGPDAAEGVLLLHHMSRQRGRGSGSGNTRGHGGGRLPLAAPELSCEASGVCGGGGGRRSADKSAAGILMSLSGSRSSMG
jgi:hypothetical protein